MREKIPHEVQIYSQTGCWVVGGAADPDNLAPNDWDILCPYHLWSVVAASIPKTAMPTSLGGWRFEINNVSIDIWPDDLGRYLAEHSRANWVYHPRSGFRFKRTPEFT